MATEAEKVVVELLARVNGFDGKIKQSASSFGAGMKSIEQSATKAERSVTKSARQQQAEVKRLENQIRQSSGQISGTLKGLAASFATYFSARELIAITDSFTRFQNSLRVAGLEGDQLRAVQERLFESGQRYGVQLETLGQLYGRASQAASTLGASQEDLLKFTDNISAAVKVQGGSVQEASGALLQLSQALQSGTVRAEEFNSVNEGLFPVLQAVAAGSDKFGGSVARLRKAVIDGEVSSKEFFDAFQKGAPILEERAAKAALTTQAAFTQLTNALTKYFGEADKANGVSAALASGIKTLADNLDTIIPALAVLATAMGVNYVRGALAATTATAGLRFALIALQNVAIAAVLIGLAELARRYNELPTPLRKYIEETKRAETANEEARKAVDALAKAHGHERDEIAKSIKLKKASAAADLYSAQMALLNAEAQIRAAQAYGQSLAANPGIGGDPMGEAMGLQAQQGKNEANLRQILKTIQTSQETLRILAGEQPTGTGGGVADIVEGGGKKKKGAKGPTEAEIEQRFRSDLESLVQQTLAARASMAQSAEELAELELRSLEHAHKRQIEEIEADAAYFDANKKELTARGEIIKAQADRLAEEQRARIEFEKERRIREESLQLATGLLDNRIDLLRSEEDLATSQKERRRLALAILDAETEKLKIALQDVIDSQTASDAQKEIARRRLAQLDQEKANAAQSTLRNTAGPLESYINEIRDTASALDEAFETIAVGSLQSIVDGLGEAAAGFTSLGDVGRSVLAQLTASLVKLAAQQLILKVLGETIGGSVNQTAQGAKSAGQAATAGASAVTAATTAQAAAAAAAWAPAAAAASLATLGANAGPAASALLTTHALSLALSAASGALKLAGGGRVSGPGTATSDSVPAMLSNGEFVIRKKAVDGIGPHILDTMNRTGRLPALYAEGGAVTRTVRPSNAVAASGRAGGGIDEASLRRIESAVERGAAAQAPVNLYPTLDPASAFEAMLNSPGGQRAFFNFVGQNSNKFNSQLRR